MSTITNHESAIEQILDSMRELLEEHYATAARSPNEREQIKINFVVVVQNQELMTTCSYGVRYNATTERHIDDPDQIKLNLAGNGTA